MSHAEAVLFIDKELRAPRAEAYSFPLRDYILGQHREGAYYWPVRHVRLFRRGSVQPGTVAHAGLFPESGGPFEIPFEGGACIHHFSHVDTSQWIEKTNRYTSQPGRKGTADDQGDLIAFAHARLDLWANSGAGPATEYTAAVAALRAVYDIVDRVKAWEQAQPATGATLFAEMCQKLETEYKTKLADVAKPHGPAMVSEGDSPPLRIGRLLHRLLARHS